MPVDIFIKMFISKFEKKKKNHKKKEIRIETNSLIMRHLPSSPILFLCVRVEKGKTKQKTIIYVFLKNVYSNQSYVSVCVCVCECEHFCTVTVVSIFLFSNYYYVCACICICILWRQTAFEICLFFF
jgi:hypothetical protein